MSVVFSISIAIFAIGRVSGRIPRGLRYPAGMPGIVPVGIVACVIASDRIFLFGKIRVFFVAMCLTGVAADVRLSRQGAT